MLKDPDSICKASGQGHKGKYERIKCRTENKLEVIQGVHGLNVSAGVVDGILCWPILMQALSDREFSVPLIH